MLESRRGFHEIPVRNLCKAILEREFHQIWVRNLCKAIAGHEFHQIPVRNLCQSDYKTRVPSNPGHESLQSDFRTNLCKATAGCEFHQIRVRNLYKATVGREFHQIPVRNLCQSDCRTRVPSNPGQESLPKRLQDANSIKSQSRISAKSTAGREFHQIPVRNLFQSDCRYQAYIRHFSWLYRLHHIENFI
ncbi:hypothetical protein V6N12_045606 [Hibiscus sabdariffa]|uniref:Uncharacterized protein n=1 Tax=Hibiscus sabdariffa TaxID=183260 RepID=A0ABR2G392_9ROSI